MFLLKLTMVYNFNFKAFAQGQFDGKIADDTFKCMFFNRNVWISIKISLKCVPKGPTDNKSAEIEAMAWRRAADKPFHEPMLT